MFLSARKTDIKMRYSPAVATIVATSLAISALAHADQHSKDLAYFREAYKAMDIANARESVSDAAAYCAPDYVIISATGQKLANGKQDALKQLASTFHYLSHVTESTTLDKCVFSTGGAEVTVSTDTNYTMMANGKSSRDRNRSVRQELWVKTPAGWQVRQTKILASQDCPSGKNH